MADDLNMDLTNSPGPSLGIILDVKRGSPPAEGHPAFLSSRLNGLDAWQVLEWTLYAFGESGVEDSVILCSADAALPDQSRNKVRCKQLNGGELLGSFMELLHGLPAGLLLTYSNILFRPQLCRKLASGGADVVLAVDPEWRRRYKDSSPLRRTRAEKVSLRKGQVKQIGCLLDDADCHAEFIGLAYFSPRGIKALQESWARVHSEQNGQPFHDALNVDEASITDLIQELIETGMSVAAVDVTREWVEVKESADLARFVYGTKAETLERLKPVLVDTQISDLLHFEVASWHEQTEELLETIAQRFRKKKIVVRSSSLAEDSWTESLAGEFQSVLGVDAEDSSAVTDAVDLVIESYRRSDKTKGDGFLNHQVLIQTFLEDVSSAGVVFTRDLHTGAPYIVINYDDQSGTTDSVTGGSGQNLKTLVVYRGQEAGLEGSDLGRLVRAAYELERITSCDSLDIEFAITSDGTVHLFQARPLAASHKWPHLDLTRFRTMIGRAREFLANRVKPSERRTVLSNMTDWNPAEMITTAPSPLAFTMYEYLITDSTWRRARAEVGYHAVPGKKLMVGVCGRPYIDVRNSFSSFVPATIPSALRDRLVDVWLDYLEDHSELHDKVEFEVVPTCMSLDFGQDAERLRSAGFQNSEILLLENALLKLTDDMLTQSVRPVVGEMDRVHTLWKRADEISRSQPTLRAVGTLLMDCREDGVLPFSILARYAFVGTVILRALVAQGVLEHHEMESITHGVHTIAADVVSDMVKVQKGELELKTFLTEYGHLRPGSYDITSLRYDEAPDLYLGARDSGWAWKTDREPFRLSDRQRGEAERLLRSLGFTATVDQVMNFIVESIRGRENAKFAFSRNLSEALRLLCHFGEAHGVERADMAYLNIHELLWSVDRSEVDDLTGLLKDRIAEARERFSFTSASHLPDLIFDADDMNLIRQRRTRPNFVTHKKVMARTVCLDEHSTADLAGRIVLIESADPGFDWVFSRKIAGLITMFGGANSHMAIRCAEFGIPAAIGCGSVLYEAARSGGSVELDCSGGILRIGV